MSIFSQRNVIKKYFYDDTSMPTYFGIQEGCLDIHTLQYRIFGAVWKLIDGKRYIFGYWFADQEKDIHLAIKNVGFTHPIKADVKEINDVYQSIGIEQEKENWETERNFLFFRL